MARSISVPLNTYPAGTYGPFSVNGFTKANTDYLLLTLTVDNSWPQTQDVLIRISMRWDNGGGADFDVVGDQRDKFSVLRSVVTFGIYVPRDISGKVESKSGVVTAIVDPNGSNPTVSFNTAITLEAVAIV